MFFFLLTNRTEKYRCAPLLNVHRALLVPSSAVKFLGKFQTLNAEKKGDTRRRLRRERRGRARREEKKEREKRERKGERRGRRGEKGERKGEEERMREGEREREREHREIPHQRDVTSTRESNLGCVVVAGVVVTVLCS